MKKLINIVLMVSIILSSFMPFTINASEPVVNIGTVGNTSVGLRVRPAPTTAASSIATLSEGEKVIVVSEHDEQGTTGCNSKWLLINYRGSSSGYVCGEYVLNREDKTLVYDDRFPGSYRLPLAILKAMHPNWIFEPFASDIDFNYLVKQQSDALGKNLIQTSNDGWKHINSYDINTNSFANNYSGGGSGWFANSPEITAYYLNPSNLLDERRAFQFVKLSLPSTEDGPLPVRYTLEGIQSALNGSFMAGKPNKTAIDINNNKTYAEIFYEIANEFRIDPYFLIARIFQEVSREGSVIVSGNYLNYPWGASGEYQNYFNFYNIGATGSSDGSTIIFNGIKTAKSKGWNNERDAIRGGVSGTLKSYLSGGQDNLYLQKWDIIGPNFYSSQYMQNIMAPTSEGSILYGSYRNAGILEEPWVFKIPVYQGMPVMSPLPPTGSPINFLKTLDVSGKGIIGFNPFVNEYTVYISKLRNEVEVSSLPVVTSASITGNGKIPITGSTQRHTVSVKAANGAVRDYVINFIKTESELVTVDDILQESKFNYNTTAIRDFPFESDIEFLKQSLLKYDQSIVINVSDINGAARVGKLGTGDLITISLANETKKLTYIRSGDLDGDGRVTIVDLLRTQRIILNTSNISSVFTTAGDVNEDGSVSIVDLLRIQKHILGISLIE